MSLSLPSAVWWRALSILAAVGLALLFAVVAKAALLPAAGAAWVLADRMGREEDALRSTVAFAAACAITAALFTDLRYEISIPLLLGALAAILVGPFGSDARSETAFERWSPAIFWCLASGTFCALIERGADYHAFERLAAGIGLAIAAGWAAPVAGLLTLASAMLAGSALFAEGPIVGVVLVFLWARSASALAKLRAAAPKLAAADLATCFGAGYTPRGSGTAGAVTAIPIGWLLSQVDPILRIAILIAGTAASIAVAYWYMAGKNDDLDPKEVVLDEHIGVLIAFAVVPWDWPWVIAAFALFRLFDIWKPWPVGWIDRTVKNPAGVMLDDVAAGLMAAGLLATARFML